MKLVLICVLVLSTVISTTSGANADFLFLYHDIAANLVVFSEPTLQSAGQVSQFLFATDSIDSFAFDGASGGTCEGFQLPPFGCTGVHNGSNVTTLFAFPVGSFVTAGLTSSLDGHAVVDIVSLSRSASVPEPSSLVLLMIGVGFGAGLAWTVKKAAKIWA